jgi:hypothetical protein
VHVSRNFMDRCSKSPARVLLAAACLSFGVAAPALAQCDIYRLDVPDFDQRREADSGILGLPNNGSVHCGPTGAMNWLAYITNHGYPEVLSGARDWQSNSHYNTVTSLINWLGTMMNTVTGTTPANQGIGLTDWLEMTSPGNFTVSVSSALGSYAPTPEEIYEAMSAGALVSFGTQHWTATPSSISVGMDGEVIALPERYVRKDGGHVVSVNRVTDACSETPRVWFRDPAGFDGPDKFTQGQFVTQYLDTFPVEGNYAGSANSSVVQRTMYRFVNEENPEKFSSIASLVSIMPLAGLSANAQQGTIDMINLHRADNFVPRPTTTHSAPGNASILGMKFLPHLGAAVVMTRTGFNSGTLYRFRLGDGSFERLASISSPGDMTVGLEGEIYVASAQSGGVHVVLGDGSVRFIRTQITPGAIAYDDAARALLVLDPASRTIAELSVIPATGKVTRTVVRPLPPNVVLSGGVSMNGWAFRGGVSVAVSDATGVVLLNRASTGAWVIDPAGKIQIASPRNVQVAGQGRVRLTSNGIAMEFVKSPNGQWTNNTRAKFAGMSVGSIFQVSTGRISEGDLQPDVQHDDPDSFPVGEADPTNGRWR